MSKTAQRKLQAYQEGIRHGRCGSGIAYIRHPFMEQYRWGYQDGRALAKYYEEPKAKRTGFVARVGEWLRGLLS